MTSAIPKPRAGEHTKGPKFVEVPTADWRAVLAERDLLREALQTIANLALAPMVDMADPPEDRARDWSHVAALAWETARAALAKDGR